MGWLIGFAVLAGIAGWAALAQRLDRVEKDLKQAREDARQALELAQQPAGNEQDSETDRALRQHRRDLKDLGIYPD